MKLITKCPVTYFESICTGSICILQENKPLAGMLKLIRDKGLLEFEQEDSLKNFAQGLISSFEREGLLNSGRLTSIGEDVAKSEKTWKNLRGQFKLTVVTSGKNSYIIKCDPYYSDDTSGFHLERDKCLSFEGEFSNDKQLYVKDVHLDPNCWIGNEQQAELDCIYDYESNQNSYSIRLGTTQIFFPENVHMFKLVDHSDAEERVREAIADYGCLEKDKNAIVLDSYEESNPLICGVLDTIFKEKRFSIDKQDYRISDIRLTIEKESVAEKALLRYLSNNASVKYCGFSELNVLISEFYGLFQDCCDVHCHTQNLFEKLLEATSRANKTAYLRLRAAKDLMPSSQTDKYRFSSKELSGQDMSMEAIATEIVGTDKNIKSVTALTKYAYKNAAISRALDMFATVLQKRYNTKLTLITTSESDSEQKDIAKRFFDQMAGNSSIDLVDKKKNQIEKIHDRYYRIKDYDGNETWIKMSGELDALRYENDFRDGKTPNESITFSTVGHVKEMTIIRVDGEGIPDNVRNLMEEAV